MIDAAIIGAGEAGVAAARRLQARGVRRILLLERRGAVALPRPLPGVELRLGHEVRALDPNGGLEIAAPDGPTRLRARRVLLAMGARQEPPWPGAVTLDALTPGALPFQRPALLGLSPRAPEALALCARLGLRPAGLLASAAGERAALGLKIAALRYRIRLFETRWPERAEAGPKIETLRLSDGGSLACDGVLLSGCWVAEAGLARQSHLGWDASGLIQDQYGRCTDPAFFAAGDVVEQVPGQGDAAGAGRLVGDYIADDLEGGLPSWEGGLAVLPGDGVARVTPQMLAHVVPLRGRLLVHPVAPVKGLLRILAGEAVLYRRWVTLRPGQRLAIDLHGLKTPPDDARLTVEIRP
ncbi:NAD(P)/FAD-dependent oxidoreductase [Acidocella facilis]|uniref:hypothetical protein n=1 Tax=Acidocella facilis TaxID=525 RepID=UPI00047A296C|nr:hypothetical protein [Acidocella facilis]